MEHARLEMSINHPRVDCPNFKGKVTAGHIHLGISIQMVFKAMITDKWVQIENLRTEL